MARVRQPPPGPNSCAAADSFYDLWGFAYLGLENLFGSVGCNAESNYTASFERREDQKLSCLEWIISGPQEGWRCCL